MARGLPLKRVWVCKGGSGLAGFDSWQVSKMEVSSQSNLPCPTKRVDVQVGMACIRPLASPASPGNGTKSI